MRYMIEHISKPKRCEVYGSDEQEAWEKFLDSYLPNDEMAEDYTITPAM